MEEMQMSRKKVIILVIVLAIIGISIYAVTAMGICAADAFGYYNGVVSGCYFDSERAGTGISHVDTSFGSESAGALPMAQMRQRASFAGWDFDTVWQIDEGVSYPTLR